MNSASPLRGVCLGAGYFSQFQYEAWTRIPEVEIVACCNRTQDKAQKVADQYGIPKAYGWDELEKMFDTEKPDFVDIITPPETHLDVVELAAKRGIAIICQKPLAPTREESEKIVRVAAAAQVPFLVHENWRWQPWYREIKRQLDADSIGELFSISVRMRMGDGWPKDAYLARQAFFRDYPRLLIYETGVHFLDTFRFLGGEVESVYARLQQRNPDIKGEDAGQVIVGFKNGGTAILDGSRYNESEAKDPRYTFGTVRVDGSKGHIELDFDGSLTLKKLGEAPQEIEYKHVRRNFAGDCVYTLQRHFVDCIQNGTPFESTGEDYLKTVALVEACYQSNKTNQVVKL
ncbi:Gfo/Idh/MocA family oxidoreductase [Pelagicoccus sp. SDUM812005]|uniref:Gfo/Idh/MocA family protein n=1 Tax=Pelagicoccus sp. SDUM812005 TaxID=3041257 RepID=UPI00280FFCC5|nr:Gfo/Idh/MocA family oxidoreductase [Pelagicoccus sp. SDUM812005]MDQ8180631.1 Gfo/Idh/MocA family oxidoreductase [Pelagicoccus sp. SDUM812005]